jgi:aminoglycoside phosphotransferase (APT) family kinase protein
MALIAAGRTADVIDVGDGRVLRRYRDPLADCTAEAALMRYLRDAGFPVPEVHAAAGPDLVLARVDGPTLAEAALTGTVSPAEVGHLLARLHQALDPVVAPAFLGGAGAVGDGPPQRVLHLDLHPENVLLGTDGPVVIDWTNAAVGAPGLDRAVTGLILAEVVIGSGPTVGPVVRAALASFLQLAGRPSPGEVEQALERRRQDPALAGAEVQRLGAAAELLG